MSGEFGSSLVMFSDSANTSNIINAKYGLIAAFGRGNSIRVEIKGLEEADFTSIQPIESAGWSAPEGGRSIQLGHGHDAQMRAVW